MKLEDIQAEWDIDSVIDRSELGNESLKISELHNKYFKIYTNERLLLKKYEADLKVLKLGKYEFYIHGPSDESRKKGWQQPAIGRIMKPDVNSYLEADPDLITLCLKIGLQNEKIDFLDSIIKSLTARGFNIKNALEWEKFKVGGF